MRRKIFSVALTTVMALTLVTSVFAKDDDVQKSKDFSGKVDIGGYSLNINIKGERQKGRPTVIFESGYADSSSVWTGIVQEVSKYTRTITYDRANVGLSDPPPVKSFTVKDHAKRLHKLLKETHVNPPYVLVGHSIGGLAIREFQYLYPDEVKGIMTVDASHEHMEDTLFSNLTQEERRRLISYDFEYGHYVEGGITDLLKTYDQIDEARKADTLREIPITVLSGGKHQYPDSFGNLAELEQRWGVLQKDLATLSDKSVHITDPNNGHGLHYENPQLVIDNTIALINRIKKSEN